MTEGFWTADGCRRKRRRGYHKATVRVFCFTLRVDSKTHPSFGKHKAKRLVGRIAVRVSTLVTFPGVQGQTGGSGRGSEGAPLQPLPPPLLHLLRLHPAAQVFVLSIERFALESAIFTFRASRPKDRITWHCRRWPHSPSLNDCRMPSIPSCLALLRYHDFVPYPFPFPHRS